MPKGKYTKTQQHKDNLSKSLEGHKVSVETRKKISLSLQGKTLSQETREKISKSSIGRIVPDHVAEKSRGTNNGNWRELVGYTQAHRWARKTIKKSGVCNHCYETKKTDLANISKQYYKEISDWIELCRACHIKFDRQPNRLMIQRRV